MTGAPATPLPAARAEALEFDSYEAAVERGYDLGWTDGLPFLLPTERRVAALLAASGRNPSEIVGVIPPKNRTATVERVAVNAAMAGCLPEHFPVVLAALDAMLRPEFNLNGIQATTHPCSPLAVVGGPAAEELGFNSGAGLFGTGNRANSAVGRAIRLVLWNVGSAFPGDIDKATFGSPAKLAYCIGESSSAWGPLHLSIDRGAAPGSSAVTVFACEPNHEVTASGATPREVLAVIADAMAALGNTNTMYGGQALVVVGPDHRAILERDGWTREDVGTYIFENARRPLAEHRRLNVHRRLPRWADTENGAAMTPVFERPSDVLVMAGGGRGPHSAVCLGWGVLGGMAQVRTLESAPVAGAAGFASDGSTR